MVLLELEGKVVQDMVVEVVQDMVVEVVQDMVVVVVLLAIEVGFAEVVQMPEMWLSMVVYALFHIEMETLMISYLI